MVLSYKIKENNYIAHRDLNYITLTSEYKKKNKICLKSFLFENNKHLESYNKFLIIN